MSGDKGMDLFQWFMYIKAARFYGWDVGLAHVEFISERTC
jgi:hypothetical protein